ncbi:MAG: o-succinylbenzoate--CoA ligase [Betaproteobacteria bacterium]|nr:o-succinylbenzoate--CoA ligase [Betaproteobacteria bacterium]
MRAIDMLDHGLRREPARECLRDAGRSFAHEEVRVFTHRIAHALRAAGLKRGSRVGFYSANCALTFIAMIAVFRAGCVWQPVHPRNTVTENLDFLLENECEYLFYHSKTAADAAQFKAAVKSLKGLTCVDAADENGPGLEQWAARFPDHFPDDDYGPDDLAWVKATGGTTGRSKSVQISHRAVIALFSAFHWCMPLTAGHVVLAATPLTHAAGNVSLCALCNGGTIVFLDKADPAAILDTIERERITTLFMPPTVIYNLLGTRGVRERDFSSLRYFLYTAAPISADRMREALEVFGPVMAQGWGLAEAPLLCTFLGPEDYARAGAEPKILSSCGRATAFARVEIVGDDGKVMPDGEPGELVVKSDLVMQGYLDRPEENKKALRDGALYTGDVGYRDAEGYYFIVDRNKDMIISGGFNIYPSEIEQVLWRHPAVLDCAVIGVPDAKWGEAVKAVVELRQGHSVSTEELREYCRGELAAFKAPKSVEIWPELPKSLLGKVLKREIRERYWQGQALRV